MYFGKLQTHQEKLATNYSSNNYPNQVWGQKSCRTAPARHQPVYSRLLTLNWNVELLDLLQLHTSSSSMLIFFFARDAFDYCCWWAHEHDWVFFLSLYFVQTSWRVYSAENAWLYWKARSKVGNGSRHVHSIRKGVSIWSTSCSVYFWSIFDNLLLHNLAESKRICRLWSTRWWGKFASLLRCYLRRLNELSTCALALAILCYMVAAQLNMVRKLPAMAEKWVMSKKAGRSERWVRNKFLPANYYQLFACPRSSMRWTSVCIA